MVLLQVMAVRIFFAFVICWVGTIVNNQGNTGGKKNETAVRTTTAPASVAEILNLHVAE